MLSYAFQVWQEDSCERVTGSEDFTDARDLFAALLTAGVSQQIRHGLGRSYIPEIEALPCPRGKIDISASLKQQTMRKQRLVCCFDEYSENNLLNQILKTTGMLLLKSNTVTKERKEQLRNTMRYFHSVDILNKPFVNWQRLNYNRSNNTYKLLMYICKMVIESRLPSNKNNEQVFPLLREEVIHRLFERFVLNYYKRHFPDLHPSGGSYIEWAVEGNCNMLPAMKTDILLNKSHGTLMIIDTKFYKHVLQTNKLYNSQTLHSNNLYQIFTYVKNKAYSFNGKVEGLLLYAKTDEDLTPDCDYLMSGNRVRVKTLDLDKDFTDIKAQLDEIGRGVR
jgi:5-methylcytosine-specific restriction enzyme subunit McrC